MVTQLLLHGYKDLHLVILPWVARKNHVPVYKHRPSSCAQVSVEDMCANLGLSFSHSPVEDLEQEFKDLSCKHIIIAGAGLLPGGFARNFDVINTHPGFLPNTRGLDAFKWAIYNGQPIGVTTHYISEQADEGRLIEQREVPVFKEDSFHNLAYRIYETEIQMMVNSIALIENGQAPLTDLASDEFEANRRMPNRLEPEMMVRFESLRSNAPSHSE